ncbi:hypothetical protein BDE02_04G058400 [Populus trichocarpa]|jgi:hypothetical protein|nr:hypothetical protein BDE02_04G058400 [Populus trichocarpa]
MRMMGSAFLVLSFLPFALAAKPLPRVAAGAAPEPVLDIAGKVLRTGTYYDILPVERGRGGGITFACTGHKSCPVDVMLEDYEDSDGLPLQFIPANRKKGVIRLSTDLNIKFPGPASCAATAVWKVEKYDELTSQMFISTSGVEGNPGPETVDNWFKIEKYGNDYKLVFCPTVCNDHCKVLCKDIGIYVDKEGFKRLALSDVPLKVKFKKF